VRKKENHRKVNKSTVQDYRNKLKEQFEEMEKDDKNRSLAIAYSMYRENHIEYRQIKNITLTVLSAMGGLLSIFYSGLIKIAPSNILGNIAIMTGLSLVFLTLLFSCYLAMGKNRMYHDYTTEFIYCLSDSLKIPPIPLKKDEKLKIALPRKRLENISTGGNWNFSIGLIAVVFEALLVILFLCA